MAFGDIECGGSGVDGDDAIGGDDDRVEVDLSDVLVEQQPGRPADGDEHLDDIVEALRESLLDDPSESGARHHPPGLDGIDRGQGEHDVVEVFDVDATVAEHHDGTEAGCVETADDGFETGVHHRLDSDAADGAPPRRAAPRGAPRCGGGFLREPPRAEHHRPCFCGRRCRRPLLRLRDGRLLLRSGRPRPRWWRR